MNSSSENINVREASVFLKIWAKIKETFSPKDMSVGSPAKRIAEFAVPMLIGNIAQQLYNTVDTIVVGKYVGDNAISAVGGAAPVLNLMLALMIGLSTGVGILVSQYFGAKDREMLSTSIGNCITLTAIGSAIIMVVGSFAAAPLLRALDTPEGEIFNWCRDYLMVCFIGIVGTFYYNILSGVLRGMGDSFSALGFLVISASLNIVLDLWFVAGLGLEVFGVALATVISQAISAFCCFLKMMRMKAVFDIKPKYFKLTKITVETLRLGIPSGLTQAIFSVAMLIVQRLTNSFGETVMAANVVVMRVDGFAMMPNFSFGQAMTMYTGQNVGARKFDRIKKGTVQGTVMAVSVSAAFLGLILLFGHTIMGLFTNTEELIEMSYGMMCILAVGYVGMGVTQSLAGVMRGAGDTMTPMWISLFTTVVLRVPVAYAIAYFTRSPELPVGDYHAIPISLLVSWLVGMLVHVIAFLSGKWKKRIPDYRKGDF